MRITPAQMETVFQLCTTLLGYTPRVWLFGSRLLDEVKGGDFDFLIEVKEKCPLLKELQIQHALSLALERKVDLLISIQGQFAGPWQRLAKAQGVQLNGAA